MREAQESYHAREGVSAAHREEGTARQREARADCFLDRAPEGRGLRLLAHARGESGQGVLRRARKGLELLGAQRASRPRPRPDPRASPARIRAPGNRREGRSSRPARSSRSRRATAPSSSRARAKLSAAVRGSVSPVQPGAARSSGSGARRPGAGAAAHPPLAGACPPGPPGPRARAAASVAEAHDSRCAATSSRLKTPLPALEAGGEAPSRADRRSFHAVSTARRQ